MSDESLPALTEGSERPLVMPPPLRPQHRSQRAAQAAQEMEELELELSHMRQQLQSAEAHIKVIEESSAAVIAENRSLRSYNEHLVRENTAIHTRISAAAELLISLKQPVAEAQKEGLEAVAAALQSSDNK